MGENNLKGGHDMNETGTPLSENQYVKELFSILQDNGRDTSGLSALLGHVGEMENFIKRAEDKIADMKSQLSDMKEVQNHPVKSALQTAIKTLEAKVAEVRERLSDLKNNIIEGCKNAVATFKEKGINALDKLASFFHIKSGLQDLKKGFDSTIHTSDKAIAKIETFASEYHSAGRAIKNMARMAVGKEPVDAKKEAGKLAKTIAAPYKAQKAALTGLRKTVDKAIARLDQLENTAEARQAHRQVERAPAKKLSLMGQLQQNLALVEQQKREAPILDRAKVKGAEL